MSASTIHGLFVEVRDRCKAKGMPFEFVYGRPQVALAVGATRVVWQLDDEVGDAIGPTRSQRANPKQVGVRAIGCVVRIFARSTIKGAEQHHHEELAHQIANLIHASTDFEVKTSRTLWRVTRAAFAANADVPDGWAGRVYEMRFFVDTPISDVTWVGDGAPEVGAPSTATTLEVAGEGAGTDLPNASTRVN